MTSKVLRFGVAMEEKLLEQFDVLVAQRGSSRSEVLRDLVRNELTRVYVEQGVESVATLTLVYNDAASDIKEQLNEIRHEHDVKFQCSMRIQLSGPYSLEVFILHGLSNLLENVAAKLMACKGVKHGGLQMVADITKHKVKASHPSHG